MSSRVAFFLGQWLLIEEIYIQRGLKQRDPLKLSLFLLVVEGLSASTRRDVLVGSY